MIDLGSLLSFARPGTKRGRRRLANVATYVLLALPLLFTIFPVYWMVVTSLKTLSQVSELPPLWFPPTPQWSNFPEAMVFVPFGLYFRNSLVVSTLATLGDVFSAAVVGYGFARLKFPGRDTLFILVIATILIPFFVKMPALFVIFKQLGWIDTFKPLIVPSWLGTPIFIFLMRQFMRTLPEDLAEAARVDGASEVVVFWRIMLPLAMPALVLVLVLSFQTHWGDYISPLIFLQDNKNATVMLGLAALVDMEGFQSWELVMSGSIVVTAPMVLVFYVAQRQLIKGVALTGIKG